MSTDSNRVEQARAIYSELLTMPLRTMTDDEWQLFEALEDLFHPKRGVISLTRPRTRGGANLSAAKTL